MMMMFLCLSGYLRCVSRLSITWCAADETKYRNLRDWDRVEENPNIDELTLWRPRADIFDLGLGALRVEFEIPGVPREDISLTVRDDTITLTALKPQSRKEEAGFHYQSERHFGKFYRRLALPFAVDPNSVRAYLELGVLKVPPPLAIIAVMCDSRFHHTTTGAPEQG